MRRLNQFSEIWFNQLVVRILKRKNRDCLKFNITPGYHEIVQRVSETIVEITSQCPTLFHFL